MLAIPLPLLFSPTSSAFVGRGSMVAALSVDLGAEDWGTSASTIGGRATRWPAWKAGSRRPGILSRATGRRGDPRPSGHRPACDQVVERLVRDQVVERRARDQVVDGVVRDQVVDHRVDRGNSVGDAEMSSD
jgi:hypothetical protein